MRAGVAAVAWFHLAVTVGCAGPGEILPTPTPSARAAAAAIGRPLPAGRVGPTGGAVAIAALLPRLVLHYCHRVPPALPAKLAGVTRVFKLEKANDLYHYRTESEAKTALALDFAQKVNNKPTIIFVNCVDMANAVAAGLAASRLRVKAAALHAGTPTAMQRAHVAAFASGALTTIVACDAGKFAGVSAQLVAMAQCLLLMELPTYAGIFRRRVRESTRNRVVLQVLWGRHEEPACRALEEAAGERMQPCPAHFHQYLTWFECFISPVALSR